MPNKSVILPSAYAAFNVHHAMRFFLIIFSFLPIAVMAAEIKPFTSDGCSAFPDGTFEENKLWLMCCETHDRAYWKGGIYQERLEADKQLKECVADVGKPKIASLMLAGVRVGGTPFLPTKFRWGYGWPFPRGYKALSESEITQIIDKKGAENEDNNL